MIQVHDIFVCKPGQASQGAKLMKEAMAKSPYFVSVLTDMTGQYHRVIMVSQYQDLTAYQKSWDDMMQNPTEDMKQAMKKMEGFRDMYTSGSREIYKLW